MDGSIKKSYNNITINNINIIINTKSTTQQHHKMIIQIQQQHHHRRYEYINKNNR